MLCVSVCVWLSVAAKYLFFRSILLWLRSFDDPINKGQNTRTGMKQSSTLIVLCFETSDNKPMLSTMPINMTHIAYMTVFIHCFLDSLFILVLVLTPCLCQVIGILNWHLNNPLLMTADITFNVLFDWQIPLSYVPEDVYKTSIEWLRQKSSEQLGSFVMWLFDGILADLASHLGAPKGSKKVVQAASSKSQASFLREREICIFYQYFGTFSSVCSFWNIVSYTQYIHLYSLKETRYVG